MSTRKFINLATIAVLTTLMGLLWLLRLAWRIRLLVVVVLLGLLLQHCRNHDVYPTCPDCCTPPGSCNPP